MKDPDKIKKIIEEMAKIAKEFDVSAWIIVSNKQVKDTIEPFLDTQSERIPRHHIFECSCGWKTLADKRFTCGGCGRSIPRPKASYRDL